MSRGNNKAGRKEEKQTEVKNPHTHKIKSIAHRVVFRIVQNTFGSLDYQRRVRGDLLAQSSSSRQQSFFIFVNLINESKLMSASSIEGFTSIHLAK